MYVRSLVLGTVLALSVTASAAVTRIVANKIDGVTVEQIRAAKSPIPVARYDADNGKMALRCAGGSGQLICEIWNLDKNTLVSASSDIRLCKDGNDFAILDPKAGPDRLIIVPTGFYIGDPTKPTVCFN